MKTYDVFNGDADGIYALIQIRIVNPRFCSGLILLRRWAFRRS